MRPSCLGNRTVARSEGVRNSYFLFSFASFDFTIYAMLLPAKEENDEPVGVLRYGLYFFVKILQ